MNIKYPLLIPAIGHGSTSLILLPQQTLITNLLTSIFVNYCSLLNRKILLVIFSIYHISDDFNINNKFEKFEKYTFSTLFHLLWLYKPIVSKLYLTFIHTPLHYFNIYKRKNKYKQQLFLGFFISLLSLFCLEYDLEIKLNNLLGDLWFVGPIISHIIVHTYYNKKILK